MERSMIAIIIVILIVLGILVGYLLEAIDEIFKEKDDRNK
jgi:hypothetical protein